MVMAGLTASWAGHDALSAAILSCALPDAPSQAASQTAVQATTALLRAHRVDVVVQYIERLFDFSRSEGEVLMAATLSLAALRRSDIDREILDPLMEMCLGTFLEVGKPYEIASAAYSHANHLRSGEQIPERNREALRLFNVARKLDPAYMERAYFASEVGAVLFDLHRPIFSARWYERAVELGCDDAFTRACWGDALLNAGEFEKAAECMKEHADTPAALSARPYWWIRRRFALGLAKLLGPRRRRDPTGAVSLVSPDLTDATPEVRIEAAEKQLELDPLSAMAWFNSALALAQLDDRREAGIRFAYAASIQYGDTEAWGNAFVMLATSAEDTSGMIWASAVGYAGLRCGGESFEEWVESFAAAQDDPDLFDAVFSVLEGLKATSLPESHPMTLRFHGTGESEGETAVLNLPVLGEK